MKAVKITTGNQIMEIETDTDKDFNTIEHDGGCLLVPEFWKYKNFKLAIFVECYSTEYNLWGSVVYKRLKNRNYDMDDGIHGNMYIMNEDDKDIVDFTIEDMNYIFKKMSKLKKPC